MSESIPESLLTLIQTVSRDQCYLEALSLAKQKYNICGTNIDFLSPQKVLQTYTIIRKKFYYERKNPANCSWFENELRIYIWTLICYLYLKQKDILAMTQSDWTFFRPIFYDRQSMLFEFQAILLLKDKNSKWTEEEIKLLEKIVRIKSMKNKWNAIARQLYVLSNKTFVKTPKQCRERWLNYLDPSKVHSPWSNQEDLTLLISIRDNGKRWAYTVKKLLKKRTEHMVKNRFNSLINNEKKRIGKSKSQSQLLNTAIEAIRSEIGQASQIKKEKPSVEVKIQEEQNSQPQFKTAKIKIKRKNSKKNHKKDQIQLIFEIKQEMKQQTSIIVSEHNKTTCQQSQSTIDSMKTLPAENNKEKNQGEGKQLQLFQQNGSILGFNPFQQATPNNQFLVPSFLFHSQVSNSSQCRSRRSSVDFVQSSNPNFDNIYHFN